MESSADPGPTVAAANRSRRLLIRAGWAALALVLVWSAAWFYVPPLVRHFAEKAAAETLGRRLTLGAVTFHPWTLTLAVESLALAGAEPPGALAGSTATPAAAQLAVRRIEADLALESVLRGAPVVDSLRIEAPTLRIGRDAAGRLDVDDVLERLAARFAADKDAAPARFAVHNIVVTQGSADLLDAGAKASHRLRELELGVPFVSSLPSQREIQVQPRLAFVLDGSRFDSSAAATPFSDSGQGQASVRLVGVDVVPWLAYLPKDLPLQLREAVLGADLRLAFEQRPRLSLRISGTVDVAGLKVVDAAAQPLLDVAAIRIAIDELRPLEGLLRIGQVDVQAPQLQATRDRQGGFNLLRAVARGVALASGGGRASAASAAAAAAAAAAAPAESRWRVAVAALTLRAGRVDWRDAATRTPTALTLADVSVDASGLRWPLDAPLTFKGEGTLGGAEGKGRLALSGQGHGAGATVNASLEAWPLALAAPYLREALAPALAGTLSGDVAVVWRPGVGGGADAVRVEAKRVAIDALRLGTAKAPELAAERIEVTAASLDTAARSVRLGRLALLAPSVRIERDAGRRWSFERWRVAGTPAPASAWTSAVDTKPAATAPVSTPSSAPASGPAPARADAPWTIAIDELDLGKGRVAFADAAQAQPVALDLSELSLNLRGFALDATRPLPFRLAGRVAVPAGAAGAAVGSGVAGSVDARGELSALAGGVPASARATLLLKDLPAHLLDPYLKEVLNVDVQKAQTSFRGDVAYDAAANGPRLRIRGDAMVDDFRASSAATEQAAPRRALAMVREGAGGGRPLLNWKSLSLRGIDIAVAPEAATQVSVDQTSLGDFFARIVLDEGGRLNLQDVTRAPAPAAAGSAPTAAGSAAPKPPAIIRFGPIVVAGGRINFNDRFVRPNYTANLSELAGRLGAFSSQGAGAGQPPQLAEIELRGRVEGSASLEVTGKLNPLATPLAVDIAAKVRDLELPPLSPYTAKYAGHGVERGKMSVDLAYVVRPDGQLTASNRIVLNQIVFGDPIAGAPSSLPVKLAVALLADRNGVIDIDLPVSGSINDPQFSIGGLIWKALGNVVVRAVTAPFSLLASALGGGGSSEASAIEFAPGTATLAPAAQASLDKIAAALAERPQLIMTVTGESRLEVERDAWKRERLQQIVRAEKRRAGLGSSPAPGAGASASAGTPAAPTETVVSAAEYPELLKAVYRRADIVKPKNAVGLAQDLPVAEMEALLLASISVGEEAMQQLAVRRGVVVRDYLAGKQLPTSRLFLGAPKTGGGGEAWTPRADLKLAAG